MQARARRAPIDIGERDDVLGAAVAEAGSIVVLIVRLGLAEG
jgi:hypothetical protein